MFLLSIYKNLLENRASEVRSSKTDKFEAVRQRRKRCLCFPSVTTQRHTVHRRAPRGPHTRVWQLALPVTCFLPTRPLCSRRTGLGTRHTPTGGHQAPHRSPLHTSLEPPKPATAFEVGFTDTRRLSVHCPASLREPISLKRESPGAAAPAPHKAAQRTPAVQVTGCPRPCVPSQAHTLPHAALTAPQLLPEKH